MPSEAGVGRRGIRFHDAGTGSNLDYCRLSRSFVEGETYAAGCGGAIYSRNSSPMITHCDFEGGYPGNSNFNLDPLFTADETGEELNAYFLSSFAADQGSDSPCIDAGDVPAELLLLDHRTTRTDHLPDAGLADIGYHYRTAPVASLPQALIPGRPRLIIASPNPFHLSTTLRLPDQGGRRLAPGAYFLEFESRGAVPAAGRVVVF